MRQAKVASESVPAEPAAQTRKALLKDAILPVALVPAALMAAIACTEISRPLLWRDELATWSAASRTIPQMWALLHHTDAVLGPYYFLLHAWMSRFGDSPAAVRLPSALAMIGAAAVVALIARRLADSLTGLAAGVIFALIPAVSRYAQEARPYAFAALFSALATLALLRALERRTWRRWLGYGLALGAAGASSLVTLSLLGGHLVAVLFWRSAKNVSPGENASVTRRVAGLAAGAVLAVAINYPLIHIGQQQAVYQLDQLGHPGWSVFVSLWPQLFSSGPAALAVLLLAAISLVIPSPYRRAGAFAVIVALVPVLAIWLISHASVSYWTTRYLIFTLPAWAVAAGCGVAALATRVQAGAARLAQARTVRYGVAALALAFVASAAATAQAAIREPQAHNWWTYPAPSGDIPLGYEQAAAIVAANEQPGDGIAYQVADENRWQVDSGVLYYLGNRSAPLTVFQVRTPQEAGLLAPVECAHPALCLHGVHRIWVVYIEHLVQRGLGGTPFQALPPSETAALHEYGFKVRRSYDAQGITVDLLTNSAHSIG